MVSDGMLPEVEERITASKNKLDQLDLARKKAREPIAPLVSKAAAPHYKIVAQGDSWFDYPGRDLIDYLRERHGYEIENIGVAGSTLNDIVYGPVPKNWFGVPQADEVKRIDELVDVMNRIKPDAVILSGGGNDIAGEEFFSFINNKLSGLPGVNSDVVKGVMEQTFRQAYQRLVDTIFAKADALGNANMPILVHGYDYPYPDGRGLTIFNVVGPWFHESFNKKNFPYTNDEELGERFVIVKALIDEMNEMLKALAKDYNGRLIHVDLRGTLPTRDDWANELHPTPDGFQWLSDKFDLALKKALHPQVVGVH